MDRYDLVVLGDANPDLIVRGAPELLTFGQAEREVSGAGLTLGGSGALMASAAARLGLHVALVGLVGDDRAADVTLAMLSDAGVDVSAVRRDPDLSTAMTVVFVRPDGDRAILTFPGSLPAFGAEHVDGSLLARTRHVHAAALFLPPRLAAALPSLLQAARRGGATTSLDTNDDPTGTWVLDRPSLLGAVDYLLPNDREASALAFGPMSNDADPLPAARLLASFGPTVVVKRGSAGASAVVPGHDRMQVLRARLADPSGLGGLVDTVGAGDAFDAGLVAGLSQGLDLRGALRMAVAVGTLSTRGAGGSEGQPDAARAARLAEHVIIDEEE